MRHSPEATRTDIYAMLDEAVLRIGRLLLERQQQAPSSWLAWSLRELPFSEDQLQAIVAQAASRSVGLRDEDLPPPWQALCR